MAYLLFVISLICKLSGNLLGMDWRMVFYPLIVGVFGSILNAVAPPNKKAKTHIIHYIPFIAFALMTGLKLFGLLDASWWIVYLPYSILYGIAVLLVMVNGFVKISELDNG